MVFKRSLMRYLDIGGLVEAVHLVEQLKKDPLHLSVSSCLSVEPGGNNSLNISLVGRVFKVKADDQKMFEHLLVAMASISSMKMIAGEFSLASRNTSLTIRGPSPRYFCTNSLPTTLG